MKKVNDLHSKKEGLREEAERYRQKQDHVMRRQEGRVQQA